MARSTLVALLVLALIQVALAVPYLIVNRAAHGALKGDPFEALTVNRNDLRSKPWTIERNDEGYLISTFQPPFFINDEGGRAFLEPRLQTWYIEKAGENSYKIKLPNVDKVLGWDERSGEVHLQGANGSPEQLWEFVRVDRGRMYRQY